MAKCKVIIVLECDFEEGKYDRKQLADNVASFAGAALENREGGYRLSDPTVYTDINDMDLDRAEKLDHFKEV